MHGRHGAWQGSRRRLLEKAGKLSAGGLLTAALARGGVGRALAQGTPAAVPAFLADWRAGWDNADPARIAAAYAADATLDVVPFNLTLRGRPAIHAYFGAYFGAFTAPTPRITLVFATADQAAAEWTFRGRYTGQLPPLPPGKGQAVSIRGANVMTLRGEQIVAERIYTDLAAVLGQLGLLPSPAGTPAAGTPAA